jgi:hypothetical protein
VNRQCGSRLIIPDEEIRLLLLPEDEMVVLRDPCLVLFGEELTVRRAIVSSKKRPHLETLFDPGVLDEVDGLWEGCHSVITVLAENVFGLNFLRVGKDGMRDVVLIELGTDLGAEEGHLRRTRRMKD